MDCLCYGQERSLIRPTKRLSIKVPQGIPGELSRQPESVDRTDAPSSGRNPPNRPRRPQSTARNISPHIASVQSVWYVHLGLIETLQQMPFDSPEHPLGSQ